MTKVLALILFYCTCYLAQAQMPYPIKKNSWGYANSSRKIVINCEFDFAFPFFDDKAVVIKDGKYGVIDTHGNWILNPSLEYIDRFINGIARARKNNNYGFIDSQGNWMIEPIWDHVRIFKCGLARTFVNGKFGFIDLKGNIVADNIYTTATDFHENHAVVSYGSFDTKNYMDLHGNLVFQYGFSGLSSFKGGYARGGIAASSHRNILGKVIVHNDGITYFFDTLGNKYTTLQFDSILAANPHLKDLNNFQEGLDRVYNPIRGYVNTDGILQIEAPYDRLGLFNDSLAMVVKNKKFSFIDMDGNRVCKWTKFNQYSSHLQQNGYMYYTNKDYETVVSDIWGNTVLEVKGHDTQLLRDGVLIRYVDNPSKPYEKNVQFLSPDKNIIAEFEVEPTKKRGNDNYWNELHSEWETEIKQISHKALNGIKTDNGWLYFEIR